MSGRFTTLFIDFDGTLVDYLEAETKALEKLGERYDMDPGTIPEMVKNYKEKNKKLWSSFERKEIDIPTIVKTRFTHIKKLYPEFTSDPDLLNEEYLDNFVETTEIEEEIVDLLHQLKEKGYKLIIVSNGIHNIQTRRIGRLGLFDVIDDFVTSEEAGAPKPATNMFELAHQKIEKISGRTISKEEILMIGDSYNADIIGSQNYGIASCWVSNGETSNKHDFTINSFKDIEKYLL